MFRIAFSPAVALVLLLALTACGKPAAPVTGDPDPTEPDTAAPEVHITSGNHSAGASYTLTGVSYDDTGTSSVSWSLNGGADQPATLSGTAFTADLTLTAGQNIINVTAVDAAGNEGHATRTVTFSPTPVGTVSPDAALPGGEAKLSGSGLGDSGTVTVGGVTATTVSWSADEVVFTVPAAAAPGPQPIVVSGTFGSASGTLFVGHDFPAGTFQELADLKLPPGTAVRLAAGIYTGGPAGTVLLDNLSLHGRGPDQTFVTLGADVTLDYRADGDRELLVQNLSLSVGQFSVGPNPSDFPGLSVQELTPQALGSGSLTFSNVHWSESGAAVPSLAAHAAGRLYEGSIRFVDSQLELPQTELHLELLGSLALTDTTIHALSLRSDLIFGRLTLEAATVTAAGPLSFMVRAGMDISDSDLTSETQSLDLIHLNPSGLFNGTSSLISDSRFRTAGLLELWFGSGTRLLLQDSRFDSDTAGINLYIQDVALAHMKTTTLSSEDDQVNLYFEQDSETLLMDNEFSAGDGIYLHAADAAVVTFGRNQVDSGTGFAISNAGADVTAEDNTFTLARGSGTTEPNAAFTSQDNTSIFTVTGNTFSWETATGDTRLFGNGTFTMTDNVLTGFGNSGTALYMSRLSTHDEATVTATGNRFASFENALAFNLGGSNPGLFTVRINDNVFDFPMTATPQAARVSYAQDSNTDLDTRNNVWHEFTTAAEVEALITYNGSTAVLLVDPVTSAVTP